MSMNPVAFDKLMPKVWFTARPGVGLNTYGASRRSSAISTRPIPNLGVSERRRFTGSHFARLFAKLCFRVFGYRTGIFRKGRTPFCGGLVQTIFFILKKWIPITKTKIKLQQQQQNLKVIVKCVFVYCSVL